jgi:hypothetical protein
MVLTVAERFYLDTDGDGHWYVIPVSASRAWDVYCETNWDEEYAEIPSGVRPVGGWPGLITFADPQNTAGWE